MASTLERRRIHRGLSHARFCSHFFNILLLLAALGAIGVSIWIFISVWQHPAREGALSVIGIFYLVSNIIPAAIGVVVVLVVLVGMCGLCTTHRCTLLWYFSFLMLAFVMTIAACVFNFIFYFELNESIAGSLSKSINDEYGLYGFEELTESIDSVQTQFECCGSMSYEEWGTSEWHRYQGLSHFRESDVPTVPPSCCEMISVGNQTEPVDLMKCSHRDSTYPNEFMYSKKCSELLYSWLALYTLLLAIACGVLFITELMSVAACAVLFRRLGPVHLEEKKLMHRMRGDPDWKKERHYMNARV